MVTLPMTGLLGSEMALQQGFEGAAGQLDPLRRQSGRASVLQAALSGASGPQAQEQAFSNFMSSPGQQFLRDRGEQALLRNASATGGLGGGNILSELQRQAIGFAAQDFGNQFARLGEVAQTGMPAVLGSAQNILSTGQQLAQGRTRAGEQIAGNIGATGSALAEYLNQQGLNTAQSIQQGSGGLAGLLTAGGDTQAQIQQQLSTLLANIATGAGSQSTALPGLPGLTPKKGFAGELATVVAAAIKKSDVRLKKNIKKIGVTDSGINLYSWDWNKKGRELTGEVSGTGVIAQEVQKVIPSAVVDKGDYLAVDYGKVL